MYNKLYLGDFLKVIYIRESESKNSFLYKIKLLFKKCFNVFNKEIIDEKVIYFLPVICSKNISKYRVKKLVNKLNKVLEKEESSVVVLSEYLYNNSLFKNYLYSNNIHILNGRFLFKCLIYKIIEYLFNIKNIEMRFRRNYFIN